MKIVFRQSTFFLLLLGNVLSSVAISSTVPEFTQFFGKYSGRAITDEQDTATNNRDLQVSISPHKQGFTVQWVSLSILDQGKVKRKNYIIDFYPTARAHLFQAGMREDKFGHRIPLDPMRGDPYIWARIKGSTLYVHALHVLEDGGYSVQTYIRTTTKDGLDIKYSRRRDGKLIRTVTGTLTRLNKG